MAIKICISLSDEACAQLEWLRQAMHLSPAIKRSTLIQQVIFDSYMYHQNPPDPASQHGDDALIF